MIFINITVILLYGMLAIISRKNYSKYKNESCRFGVAERMLLAIAETVKGCFTYNTHNGSLSADIRRLNVVADNELDKMTRMYTLKNAAVCLGAVLLCNLLALGAGAAYRLAPEKDNTIERDGYQGEVKEQDIYMSYDGKDSVYTLQVYPLVYTEEEFAVEVSRIYDELENTILGDNEDMQHICMDLSLPAKDSTGVFSIDWYSDYPEYVTSYGRINVTEQNEDVNVTLTAEVTYLSYSAKHDYKLTIMTDKEKTVSKTDIAEKSLEKLEEGSRQSMSFAIPDEVGDVRLSVHPKQKNGAGIIMLMALPVCVSIPLIRAQKMKEKIRRRDNMLMLEYPSFVNRLSLLIGTGATVKSSLQQIIDSECCESLLSEELSYTMHEIGAGRDEASAYEQLGVRLALPQYVRIMGYMSQNLRMGTKDIRVMLSMEAQTAAQTRIEYARKKGEEASAKLLFPMIILLVIVMIIIVVPSVAQL